MTSAKNKTATVSFTIKKSNKRREDMWGYKKDKKKKNRITAFTRFPYSKTRLYINETKAWKNLHLRKFPKIIFHKSFKIPSLVESNISTPPPVCKYI